MSKKLSALLVFTLACVFLSAQQQTWIANLTATQTDSGAATVTWTTAVPSDSRVYYRQSGKTYVQASNTLMTTNHSIALAGLPSGVQYQYYVSSTDSAKLAVSSAASNYFTLTSATWGATPTTITFAGNTITNTTSANQGVTITNPNSFGMKLTSVSVSGPFVITSNNCVATSTWNGVLSPNSHCNLSVVFKPTTAGQQSGALTIVAVGITKVISLSGTAIAALTLTGPTSVDVTCDHVATAQFRASGGQPPYKFGAIPAQVLPAGVQATMNASTGLLSFLWPCSVPVNGMPIDTRRQVYMAMGTKFVIHR